VSDRLTRTTERSSHREMKEDALVTSAFQAGDWAQRNLRVLGIALAVLVAAVLGTIWITKAQAKAEGEANRILAEASANYWQGGYNRTIQLTDQVLEGYKSTKAANDARRMKADALFWSGSFDSAATLYQEYLKHERSDSPLHDAVTQSLAFAALAPTAPDRASAADFYMSAARSYALANDRAKAKALYEKVAQEYKDTTFGRDAEVMLGELMAADAITK
jgi:tetratricopeptide (TPR) repeat protein